MCWRGRNKLIVISFSLAAAGMLACIAALYDMFVPKGSVVAFLAAIIPLGAAILVVMAAFTWACDKCEDYLSGHLDRLLTMKQQAPGKVMNKGKQDARVLPKVDQRSDALRFSQLGATADRYVDSRRGFARPNGDAPRAVAAKKQWHGQ
jgi:hypothetical protein